jgi:hypothetical protein
MLQTCRDNDGFENYLCCKSLQDAGWVSLDQFLLRMNSRSSHGGTPVLLVGMVRKRLEFSKFKDFNIGFQKSTKLFNENSEPHNITSTPSFSLIHLTYIPVHSHQNPQQQRAIHRHIYVIRLQKKNFLF